MAAYHWVYDYVVCRLTAKRPGSAPSLLLINRVSYYYYCVVVRIHFMVMDGSIGHSEKNALFQNSDYITSMHIVHLYKGS